jgi:fibronectin type 3 domain-containing protein
VVQLGWAPNTDEDIYGYLVFRSASGKDEYTRLTDLPIRQAHFTDTLPGQDVNRSVFYKLMALDQRQNQSALSPPFELIKTDRQAPSPPLMGQVRSLESGIEINWLHSSSADVGGHRLYRRSLGDSLWLLMVELPLKKGSHQSMYTDGEAPPGLVVQYKVVAFDRAGNASEPSYSVEVKGLSAQQGPALKKLKKKPDAAAGKVELSWEKADREVRNYKVYRQTNKGAFELYQTMEGSHTSFEDSGLKMGNSYGYVLRAVYVDGLISPLTEEVRVDF